MSRLTKLTYFDSEGRQNLPHVIKSVKVYLKACQLLQPQRWTLVFFTRQGEGPILAYNQLHEFEPHIIAVTFPPHFVGFVDGTMVNPEIPERVRRFFDGVGIRVIKSKLPLDDISEAEAHNREMSLIRKTLAVFGGSVPLAVQSVLQAVDHGLIALGERVIAITGDVALVVTAAGSESFLNHNVGMQINEIICKPRNFTISRKPFANKAAPEQLQLGSDAAKSSEQV